jgi:hypothetical protein
LFLKKLGEKKIFLWVGLQLFEEFFGSNIE